MSYCAVIRILGTVWRPQRSVSVFGVAPIKLWFPVGDSRTWNLLNKSGSTLCARSVKAAATHRCLCGRPASEPLAFMQFSSTLGCFFPAAQCMFMTIQTGAFLRSRAGAVVFFPLKFLYLRQLHNFPWLACTRLRGQSREKNSLFACRFPLPFIKKIYICTPPPLRISGSTRVLDCRERGRCDRGEN